MAANAVGAGLSAQAWNARLSAYMKEKEKEAKQREGKLHFTYAKAAASLAAARDRITSGAEAKKLKGIGDHVAKLLDKFIADGSGDGGGGGGGGGDGDGGKAKATKKTNKKAKAGATGAAAAGGGGGGGARPTEDAWAVLDGVDSAASPSMPPHPFSSSSSSSSASAAARPSARELCAAAALRRAAGATAAVSEGGSGKGVGAGGKESRAMMDGGCGGGKKRARSPSAAGTFGYDDDDVVVLVLSSDDEEGDGRGKRGKPPRAVTASSSASSAAGAASSASASPSAASRKRKAPRPPSSSSQGGAGGAAAAAAVAAAVSAAGLGSMGVFVPSPLATGSGEEEEEAERGIEHLFEHFGREGEDWEVVLLLDCREHANNARIQSLLHQQDIACVLRALSLGDMAWIARRKPRQPGPQSLAEAARGAQGGGGGGKKRASQQEKRAAEAAAAEEVMLRFLVERKTNKDLAASIMDGRYVEQKGRMLGAGNEVDRALYLVEGALHHQDSSISAPTLRTALANTQVLHGLQVLTTDNLDQTIALLARLHRRIAHAFDRFLQAARAGPGSAARQIYLCSRLPSLPLPPSRVISFAEYQARCRKSGADGLDVAAVFARQLRQLPKFGPSQIEAVTAAYPTPASLAAAVQGLEEEPAVALLKALPLPTSGRTLGPVNARVLWLAYTHG